MKARFGDVMESLLKPDGEYMRTVMPESLQQFPEAYKYLCGRLHAIVVLRVKNGKRHDNGQFRAARKAIDRAITKNKDVLEWVQHVEDSGPSGLDASTQCRMEIVDVYVCQIRKSLMATLVRAAAPRLGKIEMISNDGAATWSGTVGPSPGAFSVVRLNNGLQKTTIKFSGPAAPSRADDLARSSIFPGLSLDKSMGMGQTIADVACSLRVDHRHVVQVALDIMDTPWATITLVALTPPSNPSESVPFPGMPAHGAAPPAGCHVAHEARRISALARVHEAGARNVVGARDLVEWVLDECLNMSVQQVPEKRENIVSTILTRKLSARMRANAENHYKRCHKAAMEQDETIMVDELERSYANFDAFARGCELLCIPRVNGSVLYCGVDLTEAEEKPSNPPKKLKTLDAKLRREAPEAAAREETPPPDMLWPYYQHELLKLHDEVLTGAAKKRALDVMERDVWSNEKKNVKLVKRVLDHFTWDV